MNGFYLETPVNPHDANERKNLACSSDHQKRKQVYLENPENPHDSKEKKNLTCLSDHQNGNGFTLKT
jgi:hypothetical protein